MPQPALSLRSYLGNPLPELHGSLPAGAGGKTPRPSWPEGTLTSLVQIDAFDTLVDAYTKTLPDQALAAHPATPFPHLASASRTLNLSSEQSLLAAVKVPLDATLAVAAALDLSEQAARGAARAGADADGPVEADGQAAEVVDGAVDRVGLKYGKSPMGETEFILVDAAKQPVLVVRALTTPFHAQDWLEFSVSGPYRYNPKNKASWLWSRQWGGTKRLGIAHFVLTDYINWVFGVFSPDRATAAVSPVLSAQAASPTTVLAALTFWARSALGHPGAFDAASVRPSAGLADGTQLFPDNPARRASTKGKVGERPRPEGRTAAKLASESDVEDSDVAE